MSGYSPQLLSVLHQFYAALDKHIHELEVKNKERINCRKGCFSCCKDDLEVFGIEAENIRIHHAEILKNSSPHDIGACAFLDNEGGCRIYESRPYVCRTHGVPIAYLQEDEEGAFELRDICPLNEADESLENLKEEKIFQNQAWEEKLAQMQLIADQGQLERTRLRELFYAE